MAIDPKMLIYKSGGKLTKTVGEKRIVYKSIFVHNFFSYTATTHNFLSCPATMKNTMAFVAIDPWLLVSKSR